MTTLTFQNKNLSVINQNNQLWMTVTEIGNALGYSDPFKSVKNIYDRHADEFTPNMTALIEMQTNGGMQKVRIFSLRGAHLIGMLSHTKVAKDFRKWVLDILDKEVERQKPKQLALPEPEKKYTFEFTEYELEQLELAGLWFSHKRMNTLLADLYEPLNALGSTFSGSVYSHAHEYHRHHEESQITATTKKAKPQCNA
ncbi:P22AR C-terminal domain-containing protein [Avibacterium paragallinarum]|uniref:P22AR C-terminal domain-containing protein n=1 Tax=Avibacterium paragallinarum TaxID=728 RepID=UPI0003488CD7|nr:P22AR C-terminal domain-containing protein [Avibacterium paragallinarum]